ncbi:MAG: NAD(P)H-hydrate dehydratase [Flavobacteriales bacterium]|nr:NAD(P)H-hydrate dehydratase [Flavobacteriales bacterium]
MLPVLNATQMRAADAYTIAHEPISSLDLMERAGTRCTAHLLRHVARWPKDPRVRTPFLVVVGMGNNGGDGLVIARLLHLRGQPVRVVRVKHRDNASPDHATNLKRCEALGIPVHDMVEVGGFPAIDVQEVIVDAIFGTGITDTMTGIAAEAVRWINTSGRPVFAIDLPSGLLADGNSNDHSDRIVKATFTLTFQVPKPALLLADQAPNVGYWEVVPIGLDEGFLARIAPQRHVIQRPDVLALLPPRPRTGHKGTFGHALLVAGESGHMGAAVLATRAALRSGCGLVTTRVPGRGEQVIQTAAPEAMSDLDPAMDRITGLPKLEPFQAIGIGPGLGSHADTSLVVKRLIQESQVPVVFDADALNLLAANPTWLAFLPAGSVLTPHPKEFDRLVGSPSRSSAERSERTVELARRTRCIVVLKGAPTAVYSPDGSIHYNATGNPGMAKGGSGDVLTGLITGLLAQGMSSWAAAVVGVHLHGLAGDLAASQLGMDGMTSGDLADHLPDAWRNLRS